MGGLHKLVSSENDTLLHYHSSSSTGRNDHHQYERVFRITGSVILHFSSFPIQLFALQNEKAEWLLDSFLMIKDVHRAKPYVLLLVYWDSNEKTDTSLQEKHVQAMPFPHNLIKSGCLKEFCFYGTNRLSTTGSEFKHCKQNISFWSAVYSQP